VTPSGTVTAAPAQLVRLNLGANNDRRPGYLSVDIAPPADVIADLRERWPWETSSVLEVIAHHIFEHLPDRIHTMNELHRVLRPGGRATVIVPSASHGAGYVQDPDHKSPWTMNSFGYFADGHPDWKRFHKSSGITARFRIIGGKPTEEKYMHHWEEVWLVTAVLEAVK
jgi:predicted SAM-dependent methyltransferase